MFCCIVGAISKLTTIRPLFTSHTQQAERVPCVPIPTTGEQAHVVSLLVSVDMFHRSKFILYCLIIRQDTWLIGPSGLPHGKTTNRSMLKVGILRGVNECGMPAGLTNHKSCLVFITWLFLAIWGKICVYKASVVKFTIADNRPFHIHIGYGFLPHPYLVAYAFNRAISIRTSNSEHNFYCDCLKNSTWLSIFKCLSGARSYFNLRWDMPYI